MKLCRTISKKIKEWESDDSFFNYPHNLERWRHKYIELLKNKEPKEIGNAGFDIINIPFITLADYFTDGRRRRIIDVPRLAIDEEVMMSLTPMELQSHWSVISRAKDRVGVAGLGLGFFVQMVALKEEVTEIVVYEINQNVIDLYNYLFEPHPKIKIIKQDALTIKDEKFDLFYNDIYRGMPDMETAGPHKVLLCEQNEIKVYYFWGWERAICEDSDDEVYECDMDDYIGDAETISFLFGGEGIEDWPYECEDCGEEKEYCECYEDDEPLEKFVKQNWPDTEDGSINV